MIVTDIKPQKKGKRSLNLFLDGEFAVALSPKAFEEFGIHIGQELSQTEFEKLKNFEQAQQALERARRYLAARPRSEMEVRMRLQRYGYGEEIISLTIDRLRESGLVDDAAFADFWKQNRREFNPRSTRMMARELKQKGVSQEMATVAVEGIDDEDEAYRAGYRKAHSLSAANYSEFRRKLGAFLYRRGFDYGVINSTVERLWKEKLCEVENGTE
ncbi:MAG: RecX family transcriptional regulator [Dehalococcoidia bacterium]